MTYGRVLYSRAHRDSRERYGPGTLPTNAGYMPEALSLSACGLRCRARQGPARPAYPRCPLDVREVEAGSARTGRTLHGTENTNESIASGQRCRVKRGGKGRNNSGQQESRPGSRVEEPGVRVKATRGIHGAPTERTIPWHHGVRLQPI